MVWPVAMGETNVHSLLHHPGPPSNAHRYVRWRQQGYADLPITRQIGVRVVVTIAAQPQQQRRDGTQTTKGSRAGLSTPSTRSGRGQVGSESDVLAIAELDRVAVALEARGPSRNSLRPDMERFPWLPTMPTSVMPNYSDIRTNNQSSEVPGT